MGPGSRLHSQVTKNASQRSTRLSEQQNASPSATANLYCPFALRNDVVAALPWHDTGRLVADKANGSGGGAKGDAWRWQDMSQRACHPYTSTCIDDDAASVHGWRYLTDEKVQSVRG